MLEQEIIQKLKDSIKNLLPPEGIKVQVPLEQISPDSSGFDLAARIDYENLSFQIIIEAVAHNSLPVIKNKIARLKAAENDSFDVVPVLVAPYLSPQRQEICRDMGVCFIDLSGNVYLKYKSFYIERIGFPNKYPKERQGRDPFSDKASLILRALLKGGAYHWGVRELAKKACLNPGFVSRMARQLEDRNYVARINHKMRIRSPEGILDDWVRAYNLKRNKSFKYFCKAASASEILDKVRELEIPKKIKYALSVQAGANMVSPFAVFKEVHVYIENVDDIKYFEKKLKLNSADQGANMIFMLPYYKHSVFYDSRVIKNLWVASDIQLYLDLYGYPVRGREQAEHLFNKRLKNIFAKVSLDE